MFACNHGQQHIAELLVKCGADHTLRSTKVRSNGLDEPVSFDKYLVGAYSVVLWFAIRTCCLFVSTLFWCLLL